MSKPKTILVFVIQAYAQEMPTGDLTDVTILELIDETPEKAIERAKTLIKKKFYRLQRVIKKEATWEH